MQSEVNLTITIDHDENLPDNASGIAGDVATFVTRQLGLSEGRLYVVDGRNHISGPVRVFLRSAFIHERRAKIAEEAK
jgi:hypothetical protein